MDSDSDFSSDSEDAALDHKLAQKTKEATPEKKSPDPAPAKEPTPPPKELTPPPAKEPTPEPEKESTPEPPPKEPTPPPVARLNSSLKQDTGSEDSDFSDSDEKPAPKPAPKEPTPEPEPEEPAPKEPTPEPVKESEPEEEPKEPTLEPEPEPEPEKEPTPEPQPEPSDEELDEPEPQPEPSDEEEDEEELEVEKEASPEPQPDTEEDSEVKTDEDEEPEQLATQDSEVVVAPVNVRKAEASENSKNRRASVGISAHGEYRKKFKAEEDERNRRSAEAKNMKAVGIGISKHESKLNLFAEDRRKAEKEAKALHSRGASDYSFLQQGSMSKLKKLEKERFLKEKTERDKLKGEFKYKLETGESRTDDVARKVKKIKKKSWKPKATGYIFPGNNMGMKKTHKWRDSEGLFAALDKLPSTTNLNDGEAEWTKNKKHDILVPSILLFQSKKRYKQFCSEVDKKNMRLPAGQMAIARHAGGMIQFQDMYCVSSTTPEAVEELKSKIKSVDLPVDSQKNMDNDEEYHVVVAERERTVTFNATEDDEYELWMKMLQKLCPKESVVFVSEHKDADDDEQVGSP